MFISARDLYSSVYDKVYDAVDDKRECRPITLLILNSRFKCETLSVIIDRNISIDDESCNIEDIILRLRNNEPIQYILGTCSFLDNELYVDRNVLIPRQETEEMVLDLLKKNLSNKIVLDICTGSGCIAISVKKKYPSSTVYAIDISPNALKIAKKNAKSNNVNINYICLDILSDCDINIENVDMIISNPPYICEDERSRIDTRILNYEPDIALFVPNKEPLIFYKKIINIGNKHLKKGGDIHVEINERFGNEVKNLLKSYNYENIMIHRDMNNKDRWITATKI